MNKNENFLKPETAETETSAVDEKSSDSIASTIGSLVGKVAGAISNVIGGSSDEETEKKSAKDDAQATGDKLEAKSGKVDKETNENE